MYEFLYDYAFWIYVLFFVTYLVIFLLTRKKYKSNKGSVLFKFSLFAFLLLLSALTQIIALIFSGDLIFLLNYLSLIFASSGLAFFISISFSVRLRFLRGISYTLPFFVVIYAFKGVMAEGIIFSFPDSVITFLNTFSVSGFFAVILLAIYASFSATFKKSTGTGFLEGILFSIVSFAFLVGYFVYVGFAENQMMLSGLFFYGFVISCLGVFYRSTYDIEDLR